MKVIVKSSFVDKGSGINHKPGEELDLPDLRAGELMGKGLVRPAGEPDGTSSSVSTELTEEKIIEWLKNNPEQLSRMEAAFKEELRPGIEQALREELTPIIREELKNELAEAPKTEEAPALPVETEKVEQEVVNEKVEGDPTKGKKDKK